MSRVSKLNRRRAALFTGAFGIVAVLCAVSVTAGATSVPLPERQNAFCTNLSSKTDRMQSKVTELKQKAATVRDNQDDKIANRHEAWDQAIADHREKWDAQRQENFSKLAAKATTNAQREAVTAYEEAIAQAVTTRRQANDAARQTYRTDLQQLLESRRASVNDRAAAFQTAVSAAITAARTSCAAQSGSAATIRSTLQTALKTARQTYQTDRQKDSTDRDALRQLVQKRNAAIRANDAAFAQTTKAAREKLRTAWHDASL